MQYEFPDSALLIFCKAPIAGQVKTRLQPALNSEQAAEAHRHLTLITLKRATEQALCPVILFCAPDSKHPFFQACAETYSLMLAEQVGSNLGERMHNAFAVSLAQYRHVVLTGCDCPSLKPADLRQALAILHGEADVVIAPAEDGGYVLIGLSAPQPQLFRDMPWGTEQVMIKTRERAKQAEIEIYELPKQWDIDTIFDWQRYLFENPCDSQRVVSLCTGNSEYRVLNK